MRYVVTLFLLLLPTASTLADDSETNPVAKKIKSTLQRKSISSSTNMMVIAI